MIKTIIDTAQEYIYKLDKIRVRIIGYSMIRINENDIIAGKGDFIVSVVNMENWLP